MVQSVMGWWLVAGGCVAVLGNGATVGAAAACGVQVLLVRYRKLKQQKRALQQQLAQLQQECSVQHSQMQQLQQDHAAKEAKIHQLQQSCAAKGLQMQQLQQEWSARNSQLQQVCTAQDSQVQQLQQDCTAKDAQVQCLKLNYVSRGVRINQLRQSWAAKVAQIHQLRQRLAATDTQMQQLQQDCTAKDTKIQHLQNECTSLTATAQEATQLLEEVVTAHKAIGEKLETAHQQLQMEEVKRERLVEALKCMQHEYNKVAKAWQDSEAAYKTAVGKVQELTAQLQESDNHKQQLQQELESAKVPHEMKATRSGSSSSSQSDGWGTPDEHSSSSEDDERTTEQALLMTENDLDEVLATDLTVMDDSTSRSSSSGKNYNSSCTAGKATASKVPKLNMVAVYKKSMEDACRIRGVCAYHEGPTSAGVCAYSSSDDCA